MKRRRNEKKRFGFVQSLFGGDGEEQVHPVEFDHPGIQAEKKESAAALFRALKQIPDNQRIVFSLHKLEGQSNREIAAIMNTSLQAVESLMSRAKASLKKELNDYYQKNIT